MTSKTFNPQRIEATAQKGPPKAVEFRPNQISTTDSNSNANRPANQQNSQLPSQPNQMQTNYAPNYQKPPHQSFQPQPNQSQNQQLFQQNAQPQPQQPSNYQQQQQNSNLLSQQNRQPPNQQDQNNNNNNNSNNNNNNNNNNQTPPVEKKISSKRMISYVLPHQWSFWLVIVTTRPNSNRSYQIEEIFTFENVEYFLKYFTHMPVFSELTNVNGKRISLSLFRDRIKPAWEDKQNQGGYCYSFQPGSSCIDEVWERVLHRAIGETLCMGSDPEKTPTLPLTEEINGVVMTLKKEGTPKIYELQIWTGKAQQPRKDKDGNIIPMPNLTMKEIKDGQSKFAQEIVEDFQMLSKGNEPALKFQNAKPIPYPNSPK